jgi:hypothetical protein
MGIDVRLGTRIRSADDHGLASALRQPDQFEAVGPLHVHSARHHEIGPVEIAFRDIGNISIDHPAGPAGRQKRRDRQQAQWDCGMTRAANLAECLVVPEGGGRKARRHQQDVAAFIRNVGAPLQPRGQ